MAIVELFIAFAAFDSAFGLTCMSCSSESSVDKCLVNTVQCDGNTENCYLDRIVQTNLSRVFSAGCRTKQVCDILKVAGKKRDSIACTQCCDTGPGTDGLSCNSKLCNQNPTSVQTGSVRCGVCERTKDPTSCYNSEQCPPDHFCSISTIFAGGNLVHRLGCEQKWLCDVMLKSYKDTHSHAVLPTGAGKRAHGDIIICSACCNTVNCNKDRCENVRKQQPCSNATICG